jgi:predicted metal-binding membrane protein
MRSVLIASRAAIASLGRGSATPGWTIAIVGLSAAAWFAMLVLMGDMDQGPGTPLHDLPVFLTGWVVMLCAMMLPSELNYVAAFGVLLKRPGITAGKRRRRTLSFIAGYGIAWIAYGLAAYSLDSIVRSAGLEWIAWNRAGSYLAGSVLVLAGLYQFSTLKHACLTGCRSPLSFFSRYWRDGNGGAIAMGFRHGLVCVGCCWALMAVMFAVGVMSFSWMAMLTVLMFAEKMLPHGKKLTAPIAIFLAAMGIWIAAAPDTAPLLKRQFLYRASICHAHQRLAEFAVVNVISAIRASR